MAAKKYAVSGASPMKKVRAMVGVLLPGFQLASLDTSDALAVAICHSHRSRTERLWLASAGAAE